MNLIEGAAQLAAMEPRGFDPWTQAQIEGRMGKKLRGQGQRAIGKPSAIEHHPRCRFTGRDFLLFIRLEMSVDQAHESSIVDHGGNQSQVI